MSVMHPVRQEHIYVSHHNPRIGYQLQLDGRVKRLRFRSEQDLRSSRPRGLASQFWTIFPFRKTFVVLYPEDDKLVLEVDGLKFDLCNSSTEVRRTSTFGYLKTFTAKTSGGSSISLRYLHSDLIEEDAELEHDFLLLVRNLALDVAARMRVVRIWAAISAGADTTAPGFYERIEREVASALSTSAR